MRFCRFCFKPLINVGVKVITACRILIPPNSGELKLEIRAIPAPELYGFFLFYHHFLCLLCFETK